MTLISSVSGIRGIVGGKAGTGLTAIDVVRFTAAYATWIREKGHDRSIVVGRDARPSGPMLEGLVCNTLVAMGIKVLNAGLATTPSIEMGVMLEQAAGGIILTASHNPKEWNALKLLNHKGEFLSSEEGEKIMALAGTDGFIFEPVDQLGSIRKLQDLLQVHIEKILELELVDTEAIRKARLRVAVDAVNSVGGIAMPVLLEALGVEEVIQLYCEPNGKFPHNPEPLPEHLTDLSALVQQQKAHLGLVVDPDVDRLAMVCEDGSMFGEEYTIVAVADYVLSKESGNTVSNLSSSRALKDITELRGGHYYAAPVGEVHVVEVMKSVNAQIGGEGNGGVIYPPLHYGRDALVGTALFLSYLAQSGKKCSELKMQYPRYYINKEKVQLAENAGIDKIFRIVQDNYKQYPMDLRDGIRVDMEQGWIQLRKSNTEPIIRIYSEAATKVEAENLSSDLIAKIEKYL